MNVRILLALISAHVTTDTFYMKMDMTARKEVASTRSQRRTARFTVPTIPTTIHQRRIVYGILAPHQDTGFD